MNRAKLAIWQNFGRNGPNVLAYIDPMSGAVILQVVLAAAIGLALKVGYGLRRLFLKRTSDAEPRTVAEQTES